MNITVNKFGSSSRKNTASKNRVNIRKSLILYKFQHLTGSGRGKSRAYIEFHVIKINKALFVRSRKQKSSFCRQSSLLIPTSLSFKKKNIPFGMYQARMMSTSGVKDPVELKKNVYWGIQVDFNDVIGDAQELISLLEDKSKFSVNYSDLEIMLARQFFDYIWARAQYSYSIRSTSEDILSLTKTQPFMFNNAKLCNWLCFALEHSYNEPLYVKILELNKSCLLPTPISEEVAMMHPEVFQDWQQSSEGIEVQNLSCEIQNNKAICRDVFKKNLNEITRYANDVEVCSTKYSIEAALKNQDESPLIYRLIITKFGKLRMQRRNIFDVWRQKFY